MDGGNAKAPNVCQSLLSGDLVLFVLCVCNRFGQVCGRFGSRFGINLGSALGQCWMSATRACDVSAGYGFLHMIAGCVQGVVGVE